MSRLEVLLADLAAEGAQLESLIANLTDEEWGTPTPAEGWTIAHQVAHLAWTDEVAVLAATGNTSWNEVARRAGEGLTRLLDAEASAGARATPAEMLARWRSARTLVAETLREQPPGRKLPWFGPPMSATSMSTARLMETWAHGMDIADTIGADQQPTDRVRHVVYMGVRTRAFSFAANGLAPPADDVFVSLKLPGGDLWEDGPPDAHNTVRGSAYDFALRVTQRRHRSDLDLVATGPAANRWLDVAQAFAGPPGNGRPRTA